MPDLQDLAPYALAASVALLVYALAWGLTRPFSMLVKTVVRAGLPALLVLSAVMFSMIGGDRRAGAPDMTSAERPAAEAPSAKPPKKSKPAPSSPDEEKAAEEGLREQSEAARRFQMEREQAEASKSKQGEESRPPAAANGHSEPGAPAPPELAEPAKPSDGAAQPRAYYRAEPPGEDPTSGSAPAARNGSTDDVTRVGAGAPPPGSQPPPVAAAPPAPEPMPAPAAPDATSRGPAAGAPPPLAGRAPPPPPLAGGAPPQPAPQPDSDWDVVPVFFGTDRTSAASPKRLGYGSGRGRKLELGQALVTVPKAHKVPSIERPWAIRIPYLNVTIYEEEENPKSHFTMKEIKALSEAEFLALVRDRLKDSVAYKDHAFIFVHGYNTSFDYAIYRTAQIAYDLKFDGAPFAYSWPSGGGLASYTYDRESSGQSEPFLKEFIELVLKKTGAKSVSVIAHSMGNQPTLEVLKDLKAAKPAGVVISQIILAAPDVDRDTFENIARDIQGLANGVTLYAASNDRALRVSRNFYGGVPRAGDVPPTGPLVLPGVDTIDVTAASMDSLGLNHSGYAENNTLLADIALLLQNGVRPPGTRTPSLEQITTGKGPYWRYPALR